MGEAFAQPSDGDSLRELIRELSRLVGRARTAAFIERTVDASGVDLPPGQAWLLVQGQEGVSLGDADAIASGRPFEPGWVVEQVSAMNERGLLSGVALTSSGHDVALSLLRAREECLRSLVADWSPDEDPRVNDAIEKLCHELARSAPAPGARDGAFELRADR